MTTATVLVLQTNSRRFVRLGNTKGWQSVDAALRNVHTGYHGTGYCRTARILDIQGLELQHRRYLRPGVCFLLSGTII